MNRKLGRYCNRVIAFVSAFVVFFAGIYLTSFHSKASEYFEFYLNFAEPATSPTQGYVVLILRNVGTGELIPTTFFWNVGVVVSSSGEDSYGYADVTISNSGNTSSISVSPAGHLNVGASTLYTLYEIETSGRFQLHKHSSSERHNFTWQGYNIVSYKTSGNGYVHGLNSSNDYLCNVFFNTDNTAMLLMELQVALSSCQGISQNILNRVNSILNSVDELEGKLNAAVDYLRSIDSELDSIKSELQKIYSKADDILNEHKKSNTWLEKIYNKIVEALGLQGEESTEDLPDEEVNSVIEEEDKLMQDTTEAENSLDFSVDSNSNNVVWNVIERVLNANPRVFGAFIGIMTLGVITLLLNR